MRSMTVYNYLLEAGVFGSVLILLVVALRMTLRRQLGSRVIYASWALAALRLLLPLSIPNPFMDEFRPGLSVDVAARPVADQFRQRLIDAGEHVAALLPGENMISKLTQSTMSGSSGRWFLLAWAAAAVLIAAWLLCRSAAFTRRARRNRVRMLDEEEQRMYEEICRRCRVRPIPVYYVDRLPASCLAGIFRPFIGIPMDTSPAHLRLMLAHQLCHWKARDPWWGVVRCLCCAIHWFNPLVWMAAWLSYRDSEMACDDRVTARLDTLEKLQYIDVIVSSGERECAENMTVSVGASFTDQHLRQRATAVIRQVKGSRWAIALCSLLAAAVLVLSFATSESQPLATIEGIPSVEWAAAAVPIRSDMEAIGAARRFVESPFVGEDTSAYAISAQNAGGQWQVNMYDGARGIGLCFSQGGQMIDFNGSSLLDGLVFTDSTYTHPRLTVSVEKYVEAFVQSQLPGLEYESLHAVGDITAEGVRLLQCEMRAGGSVTAAFTVQVEPVVRVLSYRGTAE